MEYIPRRGDVFLATLTHGGAGEYGLPPLDRARIKTISDKGNGFDLFANQRANRIKVLVH